MAKPQYARWVRYDEIPLIVGVLLVIDVDPDSPVGVNIARTHLGRERLVASAKQPKKLYDRFHFVWTLAQASHSQGALVWLADGYIENPKISMEELIRWARAKKLGLAHEFERAIAEYRPTLPAGKWPWGSHETKLLRAYP